MGSSLTSLLKEASYPVGTRGSFPGVKRPGRGAIPPLLQYAFMGWCSVKAWRQLYLHLLKEDLITLLLPRPEVLKVAAFVIK